MKRRLLFAAIGALLSAAALSLGGCSKEKTPLPEGGDQGWGDRHVFLRIENKSSVSNDQLCVHFNDDESRCDSHSYWAGPMETGYWYTMPINWFVALSKTDYTITPKGDRKYKLHRDPKTDGGVNFAFYGSTVATWHQRLIVSIGGDDQENLIIKATGSLAEGQTVETWVPWANPGRKVTIEVKKAIADFFEDDQDRVQVYVYLIIRDYNG